MLVPNVFNDSLFDEIFDFPWDRDTYQKRDPVYGKNEKNLMKTDVRELENSYEVDIDLPGFKKDQIRVRLENGYLTVSASKGVDKDEQDKKGTYIRRERYVGSCSRSFYVGEKVTQEEIRARYEDGILRLTVPKKTRQQIEQNKYISIEG